MDLTGLKGLEFERGFLFWPCFLLPLLPLPWPCWETVLIWLDPGLAILLLVTAYRWKRRGISSIGRKHVTKHSLFQVPLELGCSLIELDIGADRS